MGAVTGPFLRVSDATLIVGRGPGAPGAPGAPRRAPRAPRPAARRDSGPTTPNFVGVMALVTAETVPREGGSPRKPPVGNIVEE